MKKLWLGLAVVLGASAVTLFHHGKRSRVASELRLENQQCQGSYVHVCDTAPVGVAIIPVTKLSS